MSIRWVLNLTSRLNKYWFENDYGISRTADIQDRTSRTRYPGHQTSRISDIQDIRYPGHQISRTSDIQDIRYPGHQASRTDFSKPFLGQKLPVLDVWCPGYLMSWMSDVLDVWCPGYLMSWMSDVLDVWCPGCLLSWMSHSPTLCGVIIWAPLYSANIIKYIKYSISYDNI